VVTTGLDNVGVLVILAGDEGLDELFGIGSCSFPLGFICLF